MIGKFYHRPPGGESWCDVILRLRSVLDMLSLHFAGRRVLIVAHEVIVLCFRYLIEDLDEAQILAIDKEGDVVNCGVTEYALRDSRRQPPGAGSLQLRGSSGARGSAGHLGEGSELRPTLTNAPSERRRI